MNKKVAIIGNGWVGKAMQQLFPEAVTYVRDIEKISEVELQNKQYTNKKDYINHQCDVTFICVPTPSLNEGKLDVSIVEECVLWLETSLIVIRSTVNPGDCDRLSSKYAKSIVYQPEYLGESPSHPMLDPRTRLFLILGGHSSSIRPLIDLYSTVYNANISIRQMTTKEAEIVKLSENRAIAFKVAQCQELYDVCQNARVNYYTIREAVYGDDPRFNLWWTFVYPDKRGFNSKCLPKDVYAWCAWAESLGYESKITKALLEKNKEWINGGEDK